MKKSKEFILQAIEYAKMSAKQGGYPFGAIIVRDNEIVGRSNIEKQAFDTTAHAEITAIRDACTNLKTYDLSGCKIYSSCEPCAMCQSAIKWAGITEIYYVFDKSDAKAIGFYNKIFLDDIVNIKATKIKDDDLFQFMKKWYDNN